MKTWFCISGSNSLICKDITEQYSKEMEEKYGITYERLTSIKKPRLAETNCVVLPYKTHFIVYSNDDETISNVQNAVRKYF